MKLKKLREAMRGAGLASLAAGGLLGADPALAGGGCESCQPGCQTCQSCSTGGSVRPIGEQDVQSLS